MLNIVTRERASAGARRLGHGLCLALILTLLHAGPALAQSTVTAHSPYDWQQVNRAFANALRQMSPQSAVQPLPTAPVRNQPVSTPAGQYGVSPQPVSTAPVPAAPGSPTNQPAPPTRYGAAEPSTSATDKARGDTWRRYKDEKFPWLTEIRGGILMHDTPLLGERKETATDFNAELLFKPLPVFGFLPDVVGFLHTARPHIGTSFNAEVNATDFFYAGFTWTWEIWGPLYIGFAFGGAWHNGENVNDQNPNFRKARTEFGCNTLFREGLDVGYRFSDHHDVSLFISHYSHGGLCDGNNQGMDLAGFRYGYRF